MYAPIELADIKTFACGRGRMIVKELESSNDSGIDMGDSNHSVKFGLAMGNENNRNFQEREIIMYPKHAGITFKALFKDTHSEEFTTEEFTVLKEDQDVLARYYDNEKKGLS